MGSLEPGGMESTWGKGRRALEECRGVVTAREESESRKEEREEGGESP